ncbi:signal recognition particle protein [Anaerolineae bacterium CFX7]|nr:signal recognition particle protein [Anaerolineae bacterium CFX7]
MFESLSDKLEGVFKRLSGKGKLTEADVDTALREVRMALLEADVNLKVVRQFLERVRVRAVGAEVMESLTPAQAVVKIVNEELIATLGEPAKLDLSGAAPHTIMLIGLQGSGKTTTAAKLALHLRKQGQRSLLVAADTRRPAAIQQLQTLGKQLDINVYAVDPKIAPPQICADAVKHAAVSAYSVVILDTAGRLHIDDDLMKELEQVKSRTNPQETILIVDSMTGQEAVRVADEFNRRVGLTGLILTKVDGDARGGAALSVRSVTGVPIKFLGVGEKPDALEPFYPDRLASRILGMGDVLTLIERAQQNLDQEQARQAAEKMLKAQFTLEDFLQQLQQIKKLGSLTQIMNMIPGFSQMAKEIPEEATESQMKRIEAIIRSMTPQERRNPDVLNARRRQRIAHGSGTTVQDVNELMREFKQMQKLMQQMKGGKGRGLPRLPGFPKF